MPKDISFATGPGRISYYATNGLIDASGYYDKVVVGGDSKNIVIDTEGPKVNLYLNDKPVSFGAGINIDTKAGILSLNYAIGNQFNNGFDSRSGKIHFGLTALF